MNASQPSKKIIVVAFLLILYLITAGFVWSLTPQTSYFSTLQSSNGISLSSYDDEFDGPSLNPNWYWYNEDPTRWSLKSSPGNLQIITTYGDLKNSCGYTAKNVLLQQGPTDNFEAQTKLSFYPYQNYQQAGMLYFLNDLHTYTVIANLRSLGYATEPRATLEL